MIRPLPQTEAKRRYGYLSMELALTLPILGIVLMGLLEFTLLFYGRTLVVEASRTGARVATMPGVTPEEVDAAIRQTLSPVMQDAMTITVDPGEDSGDVVSVAVAVPMRAASPDLLWPIGFSLQGRELYSETRMLRE